MSPALTFELILTAELLLLTRLIIPYGWESFIAFGQERYDEVYGEVIEVPAAARNAGERQIGAAAGLAQQDDIARHHGFGL